MKQFLSIKEAAEELGLCQKTIRTMVDEIREYIPERYSRTDIFEGRRIAVRFAALQDWAETKQKIEMGMQPDRYDPIRREKELGIVTDPDRALPTLKINTDEIAEAVVKRMAQMMMGGAVGN